jgi:hypothetical protein
VQRLGPQRKLHGEDDRTEQHVDEDYNEEPDVELESGHRELGQQEVGREHEQRRECQSHPEQSFTHHRVAIPASGQ